MTDGIQPETKGEPVAETADNPDFSRKHPLERRWTLWYDSKQKRTTDSWADSLRPVCTVSTVEEFWSLFNNIMSPGQLDDRADIYFFIDGVKPDWDEPETAAGGLWQVQVRRGADAKERLDTMWADLVLHLIGEQFDNGEDICGVACNIRKQDRVVMWTKTASNEALQMSLGRQLKELLGIPKEQSIGFISHEQAKKESRTAKEDTYTA